MNTFPEKFTPYAGKGRVLRVKEGFNPNSSSLGSIVFSMHTAMIAVPVLLAGAAACIASHMARADLKKNENTKPAKEQQ